MIAQKPPVLTSEVSGGKFKVETEATGGKIP